MNKNEIINFLIELFGGGKVKDFADFLGLKQNSISNWKARNTLDYDLIMEKCKNVNGHWLLTGMGEPLLIKTSPAIAEDVKQADILDVIKPYLDELKGEQKRQSTMILAIAKALKINDEYPDVISVREDDGERLRKQLEEKSSKRPKNIQPSSGRVKG